MENCQLLKGQKAVGIIPARIGSEEVHAKVLTDLGGKPVIAHVYEKVVASGIFGEVLIAADHPRIIEAARKFGAATYRTRQEHVCGTDRVAEAAREVFPDTELVVNIQADEPFLNPGMIKQVLEPIVADASWDIATLGCLSSDEAQLESPFTVKIACSSTTGRALYFSRAIIPYPRYRQQRSVLQHIGIYAYRMDRLQRFAELGPSELELAEGLEQLRALEAEMRIRVIETDLDYPRISIDTQQDIDLALRLLHQSGHEEGGPA